MNISLTVPVFYSVYPDLTTISLVALGDMDTYTEKVKYWDNVYGFKMSCMRTPLLEEASVSYASSEHVMSEPAMIKVSIILL